MVINFVLLLVLAFCHPFTFARAAELDGVNMPDQITIGQRQLSLNGLGTRKATVFNIKVYVAGLYLEKPSKDPTAILNSTTVKSINLKFLRDVSADKLTSAWSEGFEKNCKPNCEQLKPSLSRLNKLMTDVKEGGQLSLTFFPDFVEVKFGNSEAQKINSNSFGRVLLSIWLGHEPPNRELKDGLLGNLKK